MTLEPHLRNRAGKLHGGAIFQPGRHHHGAGLFQFPMVSTSRARPSSCKIRLPVQAPWKTRGLCCAPACVIHAGRCTLVVEADVYQEETTCRKSTGTFAVL